jgi:hypothetical protein
MKLLTLVGWFLSFALVVFLPLDIYLSPREAASAGEGGSGDHVLLSWWAFSYWSGNILGFFVIPLVQGYVLAGEFQRMERVQRAILLNVPIFLLYFVSFIVLLLLLFFLDDGKRILDKQGILAVVVAVCLAAGFTLLVCFLGYGLVKIPVQMWVQSNYTAKLNRLLFQVAVYEDQIIEQQNKVQVLFNIARQVKVEEDNEQFRDIMLAEIDQFMHEMKQYDFNPRSNSFLDSDSKLHDKYLKGNRDIGYSKLVQLNAEIGGKSTVLRRLYSSRQEHIKAAIITQDIMKAQTTNTQPM